MPFFEAHNVGILLLLSGFLLYKSSFFSHKSPKLRNLAKLISNSAIDPLIGTLNLPLPDLPIALFRISLCTACTFHINDTVMKTYTSEVVWSPGPHFYFASQIYNFLPFFDAYKAPPHAVVKSLHYARMVCSLGSAGNAFVRPFLIAYSLLTFGLSAMERSLYSDVDAGFGLLMLSLSLAQNGSNIFSTRLSGKWRWNTTARRWQVEMVKFQMSVVVLGQAAWMMDGGAGGVIHLVVGLGGVVSSLIGGGAQNMFAALRFGIFAVSSYRLMGTYYFSYSIVQTVGSLLFFDSNFMGKISTTIVDFVNGAKQDFFDSSTRSSSSATTTNNNNNNNTNNNNNSGKNVSDSKVSLDRPMFYICLVFILVQVTTTFNSTTMSFSCYSMNDTFLAWRRLPPLFASKSHPTVTSHAPLNCGGDGLIRIVQAKENNGNVQYGKVNFYQAPLTAQQVDRFAIDSAAVLQLAQLAGKSSRQKKTAEAVFMDFWRTYHYGPGPVRVFYHATVNMREQPNLLEVSNYDSGGGYDMPDKYLTRPPKNFGSLIAEAEMAFSDRFPDKKGTCFVQKPNDTFDSVLISRASTADMEPSEIAVSKLLTADGDGEIVVWAMKGSVEISYHDVKHQTKNTLRAKTEGDTARLIPGSEFSISNPSTKKALTLFCLAHSASFGAVDANLDFLSRAGWDAVYNTTTSTEIRKTWSLPKAMSGEWKLN